MAVFLPVVSVDVEAAVIAALRPVVPGGAVVATEVPRAASGDLRFPARMVRVTRTGGVLFSPAHDRPTVLVECWAERSTDAWELVAACRQAMCGWDDEATPRAWLTHLSEASGPVNYPDPRTAHARYQFVHELQVRARGSVT